MPHQLHTNFPQFKYLGRSKKNNAYKVCTDKHLYFIAGSATRMSSASSLRDKNDSDKARSHKNYVELLARGHKTLGLFFIEGSVISSTPLITDSEKNSQSNALSEMDYLDTLNRIKLAEELGEDLLVSIKFIIKHLQRSRASIYRDIGKGLFPAPQKMGKSSCWNFSNIATYLKNSSSQSS